MIKWQLESNDGKQLAIQHWINLVLGNGLTDAFVKPFNVLTNFLSKHIDWVFFLKKKYFWWKCDSNYKTLVVSKNEGNPTKAIRLRMSLTVLMSLHHMKAIQLRMSLEIYFGWWSQRKLKDHRPQRNSNQEIISWSTKCGEKWRIRSYELQDLKNAWRTKSLI